MNSPNVQPTFAVLALAAAFACGTALAQTKLAPLSMDSHTTLVSGSGPSFFKIIISSHGNIRYLESPAGRTHIYAEGYALVAGAWPCAMGGTAYDFGSSEAGWIGSPVITQPNGANTLPLTITRRANFHSECPAGAYTLEFKQVFERNASERELAVTMTVKNVGRIAANGVHLGRWFDGDVDSSTDNMYYATPDSVYAWRVPGLFAAYRYGLALSSLTPAIAHWADPVSLGWAPDPGSYQVWDTGFGIADSQIPPRGDLAGILTFNLGSIAVGASKTVKVTYQRF